MKRTYIDYIEDILTSIQEIEEFTKGMNFDDFVKDKKTANAVIRSLEVMGEAVKKIPKEIRDKLIHEYHGVDLTIVWEVIEKEIPPLKPKFKEIFDELKG